MNDPLLRQFLADECRPDVVSTLMEIIERHSGADYICALTFNRFNVRLLFGKHLAVIEDDLDTGESGICEVPMMELVAALNRGIR